MNYIFNFTNYVYVCMQFEKLGILPKLQSVMTMGPRQRYHATRALVYAGKLHVLYGCGLFDSVAAECESDMVINSLDTDGHTYAR